MNTLADALKGFKVSEQKPGLPQVRRTPKPERGKIANNPARFPVNRQAAFAIRPERSWIAQPLPEPPAANHQIEIDELKALLKTERNDHATTRDDLGITRLRVKELKSENAQLKSSVAELQRRLAEKEDIIRQLEDIKL